MNSPSRMYNVDETQICLDGHAPRVIALKGQKKVRYQTSANKNQVEEGYDLPDVDYIQWLHTVVT